MGGCYSIEGVRPVVAAGAYVHPDAVLIGDVHIGAGSYIGPLASLRGDMGRIEVGVGANVQDGCVLHCFPGRQTIVEDDGHIGHGAVLHGARVRRGALVGINAVVMDEAVIGEYAFVAAHSFIKAGFQLRDRWLAAGTPAREVRELTEADLAWKANGTAVYQELALRSETIREVAPLREAEQGRPSLAVGLERARPLHQFREQRPGAPA